MDSAAAGFAGIPGSNPAGGMDVFVSIVRCQVEESVRN